MISSSKALRTTATGPKGFTLIEVMVVVVVIAILAAIAYPSYQAYIIRANRSAAQQLMLAIASRQEQHMLDARTYTATIGPGGLNVAQDGWDCTSTPTQCTTGRYTVTSPLVAGPPPGYTITATPVAGTAQASDGVLTLNNLGAKTPADKWKK
jgi:type IV pilus assembly protein PilE